MSGGIHISVETVVARVERGIWEPGGALWVDIGSLAVRGATVSDGRWFVPVDRAGGFEPELVALLDRLTVDQDLRVCLCHLDVLMTGP